MKWLATSIAVLVLSAAARSAAAAPLDEFRFYKPIDRAPVGEQIVSVTLDGDVYAAARDGLADLRVVDAAGQEVPYQVERVVERRTRDVPRPIASHVESLREGDDNSIEIVVQLEERDVSADALTIETPLRDFERRIRVAGSRDGQQWTELVAEAVIFDYARYMDVSNRRVPLPKNEDRYYRVTVEQVTDQQRSNLVDLARQFRGGDEVGRTEQTEVRTRPLRIDRIGCWRTTKADLGAQLFERPYPIESFRVEQDADDKQTIVTVQSGREPLVSLAIEPERPNFSRAATVEVPIVRGVTTEWRTVGRGTLSSIRFGEFQQHDLSLAFPEQRESEYRIVIANDDNPPVAIVGVQATGVEYRLLFLAEPDATYRLYYGAEEVSPPKYDTATLEALRARRIQPVAAALGPVAKNPDFSEPGTLRTLDNRLILGAAIAIVVVVLVVVLVRAGRRIESLPTE